MITTRDYTITTNYKLHANTVFTPDLQRRFNTEVYIARINRMVKCITENELALNRVFSYTVATAHGFHLAGTPTFLDCLMQIQEVFTNEDQIWLVCIHESKANSELKPLERCFFATRNGVRISSFQ